MKWRGKGRGVEHSGATPRTYYQAILFLHSGKIQGKSFLASLQPNQWLLVLFIALRQPLFVVPVWRHSLLGDLPLYHPGIPNCQLKMVYFFVLPLLLFTGDSPERKTSFLLARGGFYLPFHLPSPFSFFSPPLFCFSQNPVFFSVVIRNSNVSSAFEFQ